MDIHYFDIVAGVIILLLGLKGIINGFFKELFGLIGIIGGVFIASRFGDALGQFLSDAIFNFENHSAIALTGFLITLAIFWSAMIVAGVLFKKMSSASGLGALDKLMGFVVGSGKFFLIAAVIFYALYNIKAIRTNLAPVMEKSILFPIFIEVGEIIMHIDPATLSNDINESIGQSVDELNQQATKAIDAKAKEVVDAVKNNMHTSEEQ